MRLREELRQEQDDPTHIPTARRDTTRLSVQDLTSLVPTQPVPNVDVQRSSVALFLTPGSGPLNIQITSPQGNGLCEVRSSTHPSVLISKLTRNKVLPSKTQVPKSPILRTDVRCGSDQDVQRAYLRPPSFSLN